MEPDELRQLHSTTGKTIGTGVTVTCTPLPGVTLFDGNPAQTMIKKFTAHDIRPARWTYLIHDIPQSHYKIAANCSINGQTKRI